MFLRFADRPSDSPYIERVRMVEATELISCHVFTLADTEGERVSIELVRQHPGHPAPAPPGLLSTV
jgi:hypothetical protein